MNKAVAACNDAAVTYQRGAPAVVIQQRLLLGWKAEQVLFEAPELETRVSRAVMVVDRDAEILNADRAVIAQGKVRRLEVSMLDAVSVQDDDAV
jgi:hypothetical protein